MDKAEILFNKPPVPAEKTYRYQATNFNQVLLYDNSSIYCGSHNITYEDLNDARYQFPDDFCNLLDGSLITIVDLWLDLKMDFSFEMSPILDRI